MAKAKTVARSEFSFWPPVEYSSTREDWLAEIDDAFINTIAFRFKKSFRAVGIEKEDAMQEAWEVAIHCADVYDASYRVAKFSTFAYQSISNHFISMIREANAQKRPRTMDKLYLDDCSFAEVDWFAADPDDRRDEFIVGAMASNADDADLLDGVSTKEILETLRENLSPRENELLNDMILGKTRIMIADEFGITQVTACHWVRNLRAKCREILGKEEKEGKEVAAC